MKQKSVLTRCLALALALLLAVSSANLGLVSQVFAADVETVALGELIANNYDLTEAENALLNSGLLTGTVEYDPFVEDGLVTVDPDSKKITVVMDYKGWVPTSVKLVLDGETLETVELNAEGVGHYEYEKNMFSVEVMYALDKAVAAEEQQVLLNAAANLKAGLNGMDAANGINGKLDIIVQAIPYLERFKEGVGVGSFTYGLKSEDAKTAVDVLAAQVADTNNNGQISLQVANGSYANAISNGTAKAQYLVMNGADYKAVIVDTYKRLKALAEDQGLQADGINIYMDTIGQFALWNSFKTNLSDVVTALAPYAGEDTWDTSSLNANLTATDYATLDTLVGAITTTTVVPSVFETLRVASAGAQVDNNVAKVNVVINWWVATQNLGEYMDIAVWETEILLPVGTSAADVEAEIKARGFEAEAISAFEGFVAEGYTGTVTGLTDALSEAGATYAIDFYPNMYDIALVYEGRIDTLPYGYQITLETPADSKKSYDYTINGVPYQEGTVYTVTEDAEIDRKEGAKYYERSLYAIVAENYANDAAKAILTSGALSGDVTIRYRQPSSDLLVLKNGTLDASAPQPSYYGSANWIPNTYGPDGTDGSANSFNGATSVAYGEDVAKVQFKLNLNDQDAVAVLALAAELKSEADAQTSTLNKLVGYLDTMADLNDTTLYGLNGVIDGTWFVDTNGDGVCDRYDDATAPETVRLRQYFKSIVTKILNENLTGKNLTIYGYLNNYDTNGLRYYYNNYATFNAEIVSLSESLELMLEEEEALNMLIDAAGSQYASIKSSIKDLNGALKEVRTNLTMPNEAIDLESENLGALMDALEADGQVGTKEGVTVDAPYLISQTLTVMDSSYVMISVEVEVDGASKTFSTKAIKINSGDTLNAAALLADVEAFLNEQVGTNVPYYTLTITGADLEELGTAVKPTESIKTSYSYAPTKYTVTVENSDIGNATHTITYKNRYVELPVSANEDVVYEYSVAGELKRGVEGYTFTLDQLKNLFVENAYTIKCNVISAVNEKLDELVATLNKNAKPGDSYELDADRTTLIANISAEKNVITSIVETFVETGAYDYIGLNDNALMYVKNDTYEISIQALINALLEDETFGSKSLIALRDNNGGKLLKTTLKLGDAKDDLDFELDFLLNLNGVPSQMVTVANALEAVEDYMTFQSSGKMMVTRHVGSKAHMDITLNLPEKVYEAYLTAMLATGTVDKSDVNLINHKIAYEFFEDYLNTIVENDNITAQTFENTLKRMDNAVNDKTDYDLPDYDLSAYDNYYQAFKNALEQNVAITANPNDLTFDFDANGKTGIDALVKLLGVDISSFGTYLGMVKEYKEGAEPVVAQVVATLTDLNETKFEAAMVDIRNDAKKNKLDYTTDLVARAGEITGESLIVLLDDIKGELVLNHPAIIDLNGKKIDKLTANAKVLVLDSNLDNAKSGSIGTLSGSVYLTAGKYTDDVSAYVADGYKWNAETKLVQNALYTLEADQNGNLSLTVDSGVIYENIDSYTQFALAVASDLAADLIANYYTTAALYIADAGDVEDNLENDYNKIFDIDFNDFVKIIDSNSIPTEVLNEALEVISLPDLADTINEIMQDLLDLNAIEKAIREHKAVASYTLQTQPWAVNLEHVFDNNNDYLTCGIVANENNAKKITLTLTVDGPHNEKAADAVAFLSSIVMNGTRVELVDVEELTYEDKYFNLTGGADFDVILDLSDYTTYMAIVMANGTDGDKRADLVNAVNSGNQNDLKAAFDVLTVKDVINALKVLQRNDDLATLASNVHMNVNINLEGKKELVEKVLIAGLAAAGKALEKLEITGTEAKLGNLDKDGDGWYEYEAQYSRSGDVSRRGYGLNYNLTTAEGYVKVNLFGCKWGDANHDGLVNAKDATLVLQYRAGTLAEGQFFCTARTNVSDDDKIDAKDATLILQYRAGTITKFPAEEE